MNDSLLTYELFLKLKQSIQNHQEKDKYKWFELSYEAFTNYPLNSANDLIRIIAFAYSWMPTMANFKSEFEKVNSLITEINSLRKIADVAQFRNCQNQIVKLVKSLVVIINNSIVGTSKVLHFTNPTVFPIIDSRVIRGWHRVMKAEGQNILSSMPKYIPADKDKAVALYIEYTTNMLGWMTEISKKEPETKMRDLEVCLYEIGGSPQNI